MYRWFCLFLVAALFVPVIGCASDDRDNDDDDGASLKIDVDD